MIVYTESKDANFDEDDDSNSRQAPVSLKIIGEKGSSEVFKLENMNINNFMSGENEEFKILTDNNIGVPTHIILHFKDKDSYDWVVNKVIKI